MTRLKRLKPDSEKLRRGRRVCCLCLLRQMRKSSRIVYRQLSQDLAIEFDAGFLQSADELVIVHSVQAGAGADAHDPQRAVLALFLLAAGIGKLQPALDGFFCRTVK